MRHKNAFRKGKYLENQMNISYPHAICERPRWCGMTPQSISTGWTHICLGGQAGLSGERMKTVMKQRPLCENLCTIRFRGREFLSLSQVRQKVFLEFSNEKRSGTDGATSGGECVGPSSIDKVRYASQQRSSDMASKNWLSETGCTGGWGSTISSLSWNNSHHNWKCGLGQHLQFLSWLTIGVQY